MKRYFIFFTQDRGDRQFSSICLASLEDRRKIWAPKEGNVLVSFRRITISQRFLPQVTVTILTGLPGSGTENLCKALVALARESSR